MPCRIDPLSVLGVSAVGHSFRGPSHVQDVPQLQSHVLLEALPARALAEPPENVPGPAHGHAMPVHRGRGQSERPARRAAVHDRPARLPDARPRGRQMLLLGHRVGRQVRAWRRRRHALRTGVRQVDGHRPGAGSARTAVQVVQPGHAVRAARVGVRAERGARPGTGTVGAARGVQVRENASGQESARRRPRVAIRVRRLRTFGRGRRRRWWWWRPRHSDTNLVAGT